MIQTKPVDQSCWTIRSIRLLSHLPILLSPSPTLSISGSRIGFQSLIKSSRFGSSRNCANRWKKGSPLHNDIGHINLEHPELEAFNDYICIKGCFQLAKIPKRRCGSRILKKRQSLSSTRQSSSQMKWVSCTAVTFSLRFESSPSIQRGKV